MRIDDDDDDDGGGLGNMGGLGGGGMGVVPFSKSGEVAMYGVNATVHVSTKGRMSCNGLLD